MRVDGTIGGASTSFHSHATQQERFITLLVQIPIKSRTQWVMEPEQDFAKFIEINSKMDKTASVQSSDKQQPLTKTTQTQQHNTKPTNDDWRQATIAINNQH